MTLDKLVNNLVTGREDKRTVSNKYSFKYVVDTQEQLGKLEETNLQTADGLKTYATITGDDPSKLSQEKVKIYKTMRLNEGQEDLSHYVNKHIKKIIGEIKDDDTRIELSFKYCPDNDIEGNHKPYNATAKIVRDAQKELKDISEDPKKYVTTQMKGESDNMKHYITKYTNEFLDICQREAQMKGIVAITKYDAESPGRFLKVTGDHFKTQSEIISKKQNTIIKAISADIEKARKIKMLSAQDEAKIKSARIKELQDLSAKYTDAGKMQSFIQEVMGSAINEEAQKREAKKVA